MWTYEHSVVIEAPREAIWSLYMDVASWPDWDAGIQAATLDGPFAVGAPGQLEAVGQPSTPFRLTEVQADELFVNETDIPGAVLRFSHRLQDLGGGGTRVTHRVEIDGPAADQIGPVIGPQVSRGIPAALASLGAIALERHTNPA